MKQSRKLVFGIQSSNIEYEKYKKNQIKRTPLPLKIRLQKLNQESSFTLTDHGTISGNLVSSAKCRYKDSGKR